MVANETSTLPASADVVVVGSGPGGMAAAVEAAREGAKPLLLEVSDAIGGNAARSSGYIAFVDSDLQRQRGIRDSAEAFFDDLLDEVDRQRDRYGIVFDEMLARLFAEESPSTYRFLTDLGMRFGRLVPRPLQHTVPRMVALSDSSQFRSCFEPALAKLGVKVVTGARVTRLLHREGRVQGVEVAGSASSSRRVRADRGIVLATGGYQASSELRLLYQPERLAVTSFPGLTTCRGDGHVMGQSVGAQLINMTVIPIIAMVASALLEAMIAVNRSGERFHDETGPYDARVDAVTAQSGGDCYYLFDGQAAASRSRLVDSLGSPPVKAKTLEELAAIIGCDSATLRRTVQDWNDFLRSGSPTDPAFGRVVLPDPPLGIEVPPFYASRITLGANFTAGGFRTDQSLRVLDVYGDPITGLYAAGDCVGGVNVAAGLGGVHIASAIALGRVAGRSVATASASPR